MEGLDQFFSDLSTTDTKKKLTTGENIINFLGNPDNSIQCEDTGAFIDALVPWMQSSNFKVSQNGLDIVGHMIDRLGSDFRPYLNTVLASIVDRLGDSREVVREKANIALCKLMDATVAPQLLFEKMTAAFTHKNGKVREEILLLLQNTLNAHGAQSLTVSKFIPFITTSLSDSQAAVREASMSTLVEIYRHVGEKVRMDLQRRGNLPANKTNALMARFDEVRAAGNMMPTATLATGTTDGMGEDDTDRASVKSGSVKSRSSSVPAHRDRKSFATPKPPTGDTRGISSAIRRQPSVRYGSTSGGQAGAVDEDSFIQAFEDVKKVTIFSGRGLEDELNKIHHTLANQPAEWKLRIEALSRVRSLVIAGAGQFDELVQSLKSMEMPFESCVKDLRSQVVRECCITIAFLSQQIKHKVDRFLEFLLPSLINLIQNSAKVMATSGIVCIRFLIQNSHSTRFLPVICQSVASKSKEIRRHICEFLDQLLHTWPTHSLEKHVAALQDAIKKGISDADPEARVFARKAYWGFADHFKDQADILLSSLDPSYKRMLQGEMSNSSSSNSLNTMGNARAAARSRQSSVTGSTENLDHPPPQSRYSSATLGRKGSSGIPKWSSPKGVDGTSDLMTRSTLVRQPSLNGGSPRHTPPGRSNSAIDSTAARRASVRQAYSQRGRLGMLPGASLPRPRKSSDSPGLPLSTPDRSRGNRKPGGISQSQPGSRSASPSSLKSYQTYFDTAAGSSPGYSSSTVGRSAGRKRSGIPRSTGTSRETSPQRFGNTPVRGLPRPGARPPVKPLLTEKILRQSREAESALADALNTEPELKFPDPIDGFLHNLESNYYKSARKRSNGPFDLLDNSDESETSSLCSEKSFDYGRPRPSDDISEIIGNCASTHWADRKDGLIGLQSYFREGRMLSGTELRRVTEIFTKMFMDAHTKVFALFLETLCELVSSHKADLYDWLYVLLTRLITKLGADLLGSVVHKIHRTLDVVRESFNYEEQLAVIFKYMTDSTQTPNSKVKLAALNYLKSLVTLVESADIPTNKEAEMALAKLITWTSEPKSVEIRRAATQALTSMFHTHTPQMTEILQKLPQMHQESAAEILENKVTGDSPLKLTSPMKPRSLQPPHNNGGRTRTTANNKLLHPDESENMNPDEVNKSLRLTANAIQNYSFDKNDKIPDMPDEKDSGISQVSDAGLNIEEKLAALELEGHMRLEGRVSNGRGGVVRPPAAMDDMLYGSSDSVSRGDRTEEDGKAVIQDIISTLQTVKSGTQTSERRSCMTQLIKITRNGPNPALQEQFRSVLRVLLENLEDEDGSTRALVFGVLTEMLKQDCLQHGFQGFTELVILKVLQAHKDPEKDVVRAAESCAATMAGRLPADMVVRVLNPIIKTGDFPVNQAAIKMLTKLVEKQNPESICQHLADIMPGLLKAYDNVESSVRKAAVFSIVALHQLVGESNLQPHLDCLNGSKMKLLSLYIKRAQAQSTPASPRLTPS